MGSKIVDNDETMLVVNSILFALMLGSPVQQSSPAQTTPPAIDPLGGVLKASGLSFTDITRFYKLKFDYSDSKRSQYVYIRKAPETFRSLSVQEIYSLLYESPTAPSPEVLRKVFVKIFTIGGLVLEAPSAGQSMWRIRFRIDAPTVTTPERLKQYLLLAAGTADALEQELSTEDKL